MSLVLPRILSHKSPLQNLYQIARLNFDSSFIFFSLFGDGLPGSSSYAQGRVLDDRIYRTYYLQIHMTGLSSNDSLSYPPGDYY